MGRKFVWQSTRRWSRIRVHQRRMAWNGTLRPLLLLDRLIIPPHRPPNQYSIPARFLPDAIIARRSHSSSSIPSNSRVNPFTLLLIYSIAIFSVVITVFPFVAALSPLLIPIFASLYSSGMDDYCLLDSNLIANSIALLSLSSLFTSSVSHY